MTHGPENLTISETIDIFRIGRTTLFHLIASGQIEAVKLGSRTLVKAESARSYIADLPRAGSR